jgi:hypothetical protein
MTDFQIKRLPYNLTAHAGLSLVGQYLKRFAQIDQVIDPRFPIAGKGGIATSSLITRVRHFPPEFPEFPYETPFITTN